jgi:EAL domain-containing protein (putative c-di-GMP-specific phosphodiesterase class I)
MSSKPPNPADQEKPGTLRAEWLQYRAWLHDRDTGLPTVPTVLDKLRRQLEDGGSVGLLVFMLNPELQLEESWGWQRYDRLVFDFVEALRVLSGQGEVPAGILCVPAVRSDEVFFFMPFKPGVSPQVWLRDVATRMHGLVGHFLKERLASNDPHGLHAGRAVILFDPKVRVERAVYRGIRDARRDIFLQMASQEESGAAALKGIIARRDVVSVFQPIYDLVERRVSAVEALTRGPEGSGFEDAEILFSLAERVGLAPSLEGVCRQRSLEAIGRSDWRHLVFLNLSSAAASAPDLLAGTLLKEVRDAGLDPRRMVIEVTERTYAENQERFGVLIGGLRREGFRVAVDDLGSGYSNLSSLAEIRPEFLKFDHLFTRSIHRHRIKQDLLGAILSFASKMETQVIAEGIETEEEFEELRRLGVPMGQGFLLGRPGTLAELAG